MHTPIRQHIMNIFLNVYLGRQINMSMKPLPTFLLMSLMRLYCAYVYVDVFDDYLFLWYSCTCIFTVGYDMWIRLDNRTQHTVYIRGRHHDRFIYIRWPGWQIWQVSGAYGLPHALCIFCNVQLICKRLASLYRYKVCIALLWLFWYKETVKKCPNEWM